MFTFLLPPNSDHVMTHLGGIGHTQLRASSYEPGNRAGSVTGTNSVVCLYGKFQPGRPG